MSEAYRGNNQTVWELAPHTAAKHAILRGYLGGYFAIMSRGGFPELWFVDGFAGPGVYQEGEPGSPVVALSSALALVGKVPTARLTFYFAEPDQKRNEMLRQQLAAVGDLPKNVQAKVSNRTFSESIGQLLDALENQERKMPPTLVMLDPFGWADMPMMLLERLGKHPKTEFLVSLMTSEIIRRRRPHVEESLGAFFGRDGWQSADERGLLDIYVSQLETVVGMKYVRSFALRDENSRVVYFLVFATRDRKGLEQMKRAMWSTAPTGDFSFSDATKPDQLTMFAEPEWQVLERAVWDRFAGSSPLVQDIEDFVLVDTAFLPSHLRQHALVPLEAAGRVVVSSGRSRAGTFPQGSRLEFR